MRKVGKFRDFMWKPDKYWYEQTAANEHEIKKSAVSLAAHGTDTESRELNNKRPTRIISFIALAIALFGGIPGILTLKSFLNKTSVKIIFDRDNSRFVPISSQNAQVDGKTALILLQVRVVGTGELDAYISNIETSVRYKSRWIPGKRMRPKLGERKDSNGILKKWAEVRYRKDKDTIIVVCMNWKEFKPGQYELGYGESTAFSFACYYDIPGEDRYAITKLRVRICDYLGNSYQIEVGTDSMMFKNWKEVVLLAD